MKTIVKRMIGAARFDRKTYEAVEADKSSTASAILIVVIASIAGALGTGTRDWAGLISVTIAAIFTWILWIGLTLVIGLRVMPSPETHTNVGEVVRTTGFSAAPGVLRIFASIPGVGVPIFLGVTIWMLFTFVTAVRQALDFDARVRLDIAYIRHQSLLFDVRILARTIGCVLGGRGE
jgi:hypothetical protein